MEQIQGTEKLVHHTHSQNPETIYNVVYTGKSTLQAKRQDEIQDNTVQLEVNLANLRKLYPSLNTFDENVMKLIGQQLIDGIQIDGQGKLLVDYNKINPSCIQITENRMTKTDIIEQKSELSQRTSLSKTLTKKTTYFEGVKYLVIINYIERKIDKILPNSVDHVFEEYEILFQIIAINMNDKDDAQMLWEISTEEA